MGSTGKLLAIGGAVVLMGTLGYVVLLDGDTDAEGVSPVVGQAGRAQVAAEALLAAANQEASALELPSLAQTPAEVDAALLTAAASEAELDLHAVGLIGRLVDEAGRGIPDVRVRFVDVDAALRVRFTRRSRSAREVSEEEPLPLPETTTDRQGRFRLPVERAGDVGSENDSLPSFLRNQPQIVATHESFATVSHPCGDLGRDEYDAGVLVMAAGTRIVGRVVDEVGRALSGVEVSARHVPEDGRAGMRMFRFGGSVVESLDQIETGDDGRFEVTGLPAGPATLTATRHDRRLGHVGDLDLTAGLVEDVGDIVLEPGAAIAGYVFDPDGEPVLGAGVRVSSMARIMVNRLEDAGRETIGHEFSLNAQTDETGWFELSGLAKSTYTVHVDGSGFAPFSKENVPSGTRDLSLELSRNGLLLVAVRSARDGSPVDGATIVADGGGFRGFGNFEQPDREVLIGEALQAALDDPPDNLDGYYLVTDTGPDGTDLTVDAPGFAVLEVEGPGTENGNVGTVDVTLQPESVIRGRVVDGTGAPVEHADVAARLVPEDEGFGSGRGGMRRMMRRFRSVDDGREETSAELRYARSDARGVFELRGASEGTWELTADADGFARSEPLSMDLPDGGLLEDVELSIVRAGSIVGLVTDARGELVPGVTVRVERVREAAPEDASMRQMAMLFGDESGDSRRLTTDPRGEYEATDLAPGDYNVSLAGENGGMRFGGGAFVVQMGGDSGPDRDVVPVVVKQGEQARVDLIKPLGGEVIGTVLAGGRPVEGVSVRLAAASGGDDPSARMRRRFGSSATAITDERGEYIFEDVDVAGGHFTATAIVPGATISKSVELEVIAGQTTTADILFEGSSLLGRLVDADTGEGVSGVIITAAPARTETTSTEMMVVSMVSSGRGGPGGMSMTIGGDSESTVRTNSNGEFEVKWLDPGEYMLRTGQSAYIRVSDGPHGVSENAATEGVELKATLGAVVEGRVRRAATGDMLPGASLQLLPEDGRMRMGSTDDEGHYRFEGLEAGGFTINVMGSGFGSGPVATKDVELDAGEVRTVDLDAGDEPIEGASSGFGFPGGGRGVPGGGHGGAVIRIGGGGG